MNTDTATHILNLLHDAEDAASKGSIEWDAYLTAAHDAALDAGADDLAEGIEAVSSYPHEAVQHIADIRADLASTL